MTQVATSSYAGQVSRLRLPHARRLITETPSVWRQPVLDRLSELCRLPVGWDGYRAGPVDFATASFALNMLAVICSPETPPPSVVPGPNGDVQVEWHTASEDVEIHVREPNRVTAWRHIVGRDEDDTEFELTNDFTELSSWINALRGSLGAVRSAA